MSYEILSDHKTRKQYDRSEVIADPGAAIRRAAVDAAMKGASNVGKNVFNLGAAAVQTIFKQQESKDKTD
jgi:DnaJ-class molecular chaperone